MFFEQMGDEFAFEKIGRIAHRSIMMAIETKDVRQKAHTESCPGKLQNLIHIVIGIVCIGLLPRAQAVVPPPDGGYPGGNTAEGQNALFSLSENGGYNTAVGWYSLFANTAGNYNTAVGAGALSLNTDANNTATGAAALLLNTTGTSNTANGVQALALNDEGNGNTATGAFALLNNTIGGLNTANGYQALAGNVAGANNTATGAFALSSDSILADSNTTIGGSALFSNTEGMQNTASGAGALFGNTTGSGNTALALAPAATS